MKESVNKMNLNHKEINDKMQFSRIRDKQKTLDLFRKHGFNITYEIDKGIFWNTIHISGFKYK